MHVWIIETDQVWRGTWHPLSAVYTILHNKNGRRERAVFRQWHYTRKSAVTIMKELLSQGYEGRLRVSKYERCGKGGA